MCTLKVNVCEQCVWKKNNINWKYFPKLRDESDVEEYAIILHTGEMNLWDFLRFCIHCMIKKT